MAIEKIKVRYIKCHDFRTVLSTGFMAARGSNGLFNINFYVDRDIIPQSITATIDSETNQQIGETITDADGVAAREVQFGTLLDLHTAKRLVEWLSKRIEEADNQDK